MVIFGLLPYLKPDQTINPTRSPGPPWPVVVTEALPVVPSHLLVAEACGDDPSGQREEPNAWPSGAR